MQHVPLPFGDPLLRAGRRSHPDTHQGGREKTLNGSGTKVAFEYQRRSQQPVPNTPQFFQLNGFSTGIDYWF